MISYEEDIDQTEDGQNYRQQYINQESSANQHPNGEANNRQADDPADDHAVEIVPQSGDHAAAKDHLTNKDAETHSSDTDLSTSKRLLDSVVDPSIQDQASPRKQSCLPKILTFLALKRAKS